MPLPNYKDGSLLNLMSSISVTLGVKSKYKPLKICKPSELKGAQNIVLMVFDGLGFEYIQKHGKGSVFQKYLRGKITAVFPTVTSTAIPTFSTGLDCLEHEMTGWHMYLKEFGSVIKSLPYSLRTSRLSLGPIKDINKVFTLKSFTEKVKAQSFVVTQDKIVDSPFSIATAKKAKRFKYSSMNGFFKATKKVIKLNKKKKYVYAYWPMHDTLCHDYGKKSKKVLTHFKKLNKELTAFLKSIEGTNTTILITADHGIIDVPENHRIEVHKHPQLAETLRIPLCGDLRYAYCYVKPDKTKQFEDYVKTKLKHCCTLHKSKDLVKKKYFGLSKPSKRFLERIGDYTLIMKKDYAIYDFLTQEKKRYNIGDHGALSKEEIYVPLVVIKR